jgi:hypothetical protein
MRHVGAPARASSGSEKTLGSSPRGAGQTRVSRSDSGRLNHREQEAKMSSFHRTASRALIGALAACVCSSLACVARADTVHQGFSEGVKLLPGRAGGPAPAAPVPDPRKLEGHGPQIGITFDPAYAERTNMHRAQAHEGPVEDRTPGDVYPYSRG